MRTLLVLIAMSGLAFGVWKWTRLHEAKKRAAMMSTATAASDEPVRAVEPPPSSSEPAGFLGVVLTGETVDVASKVEGRIQQVFVKAGDKIVRGQTMAQLDVTNQKQELIVATAQLREAQQRLARRIPLARGGVGAISSEELSETRSAVLQQQARVQLLKTQVAEARLVAPFDGVVASRFLDVGTVVAPGRPVFRVLGKSDPKVRFAIPEDKVSEVTLGARVRIHVTTPSADLVGVIDSLSPEVDAGSRLALGTARLTLPDAWRGRLSTGLLAYVRPDKS